MRYVVIVLRQVCMRGMIISKCRMVEQREGACLWGMWPCIYWPHFCRCLPQGRGWTHGPHVISMKSYRGMCSHLALVTSLVCLIVFDLWVALRLPSNHSTFDTSRHAPLGTRRIPLTRPRASHLGHPMSLARFLRNAYILRL